MPNIGQKLGTKHLSTKQYGSNKFWTVTGHEDPKKWLGKMVFIELFEETLQDYIYIA